MKLISPVNLPFRGIFSRLRHSAFVKNVLIVMTGTAAAQAIGFALTPVISRLYSPSDFGVFGSFDAVLSVIAAGVTLDYSQAVILPRKKEDAINLFTLSCVSATGISVLFLAAFIVLPGYFQALIKAPGAWVLALLAAAILVTGINQACQAWCVRAKAFKVTSASQVIRSLCSSGAQIGFGFLRGGPIGLIFSSILAEMFATLNLARVAFRDLWPLRGAVRWARMKALAGEYLDFPLYSASLNVINALSMGLPVLLLTHFYGIAVAGAYVFGMRILSAPMGFVLRALRQVLFQKAAETKNQGGRLLPLYVKITGGLFALALIPALILFVWSPPLFAWIFGPQWQQAGEFARYLVLWLLFMFCNLPSILFSQIIRIQRAMFVWRIFMNAARILTLVLCGMYLSELHTVMLFSLVGVAMNLSLILMVGNRLVKAESKAFDWNLSDLVK